jgi:peptidoglycan hydrolase-like protein with peptidoglycan-binding domain
MARRKKKSAMTATVLTRLPLLAGSAVAAYLGRFGLWSFNRYMRAPLASTGLVAMVSLTALAGSNALYFQTARHPAPLFAPSPTVPEPVEMAVPQASPLLAPLPAPQSAEIETDPVETTGSVTPAAPAVQSAPSGPVGNAEVYELQKKLSGLGLFEGTVDGYYGPMTARAIRAFEERNGLEPTGALSRNVIDAILRADAAGVAPAQAQPQMAAAAPAVAAQPVARQAPAPPAEDRVVARLPEVSPAQQAFDSVTETAATTIDSIVAAVEGGRQTPAPPDIKPIPALPLMASSSQPMPAPVGAPTRRVASLEPMTASAPATVDTPAAEAPRALTSPANDPQLVSQVQRGLASLGFLVGPIDGQPGEATAKAIRSFEVFHNYEMTGKITPELPGLLRAAGAAI